ncbi:MAG: CehA/McbA family metallohydrolase, partial [Polyangia bacterium]
MLSILFASVISTLHLQGTATPGGGDYIVVPFVVPAGTVELEVAHDNLTPMTILDFGVWSPQGFRGWGGGLTDATTIGVDESSRGYLIGPITPGSSWQLVIGKANLSAGPAQYTADLTFRDAATLTTRMRAPYAATVLAQGARWYKGDLHCHSSESGDANASFQQMIDLARARHLDFIVLSDHNTVSQDALIAAIQPSVPDLLLIRGIEVTTYGGHGGAMGASAYVDHRIGLNGRTAAQMIADVNAQGGAFIVNHPMLDLGDACIGCAWKHA